MQLDFHYCCVKYLATAAGFGKEDAQIIAYASQYVDDATEHKPIRVRSLNRAIKRLDATRNVPLTGDGLFEPTCSAHKGLQLVRHGLTKAAQRKVYIPFHFLPARWYSGSGPYDYRVRAGSATARGLVRDAIGAYGIAADDGVARLRALIRMGIALHTYADTWSHWRFSGRLSDADNDVDRIRLRNEHGELRSPGLLHDAAAGVVPAVGHAQALTLPDQPQLEWQYRHAARRKKVPRNNTEIFLKAARAIYRLLCEATRGAPRWDHHETFLRIAFEGADEKKPLQVWREQLPRVRFAYDPLAWRKAALEGDRHDWDRFETAAEFRRLRFAATDDLKWFLFHFEAKDQRLLVTKRIREDLG